MIRSLLCQGRRREAGLVLQGMARAGLLPDEQAYSDAHKGYLCEPPQHRLSHVLLIALLVRRRLRAPKETASAAFPMPAVPAASSLFSIASG